MKELNWKLRVIRRVVVHLKYRTIGLGHRLLEKTLPKAPTHYVELIAVMAQYNPFAEKAGMKKIAVKKGNPEAFNIADVLRKLHVNMQLLGSKRYLSKELETLKDSEFGQLKKAFLENRHPKFQSARDGTTISEMWRGYLHAKPGFMATSLLIDCTQNILIF